MSFLDHLEELRWHIIRSLAAVAVVGIVLFVMKTFVFEKIIFAPMKDWFPSYGLFGFTPPELQLLPRALGEEFFVHIKVSAFLGLIVAFPYIFWEFWKFVSPGLYAKEKKAARGIVVVCSLLFLTGVLFGYYVIAPFAIKFLGEYSVGSETINSTTLDSYVSYLTMFTIPTGLVFELPIVVHFLSKVGLVTAEGMKKYRRHSIVVILILAALITPPDVITQFLIGVPVYILYELSIFIAKKNNKPI